MTEATLLDTGTWFRVKDYGYDVTSKTITIRNKVYDTLDGLNDSGETFDGFKMYKQYPQHEALATPCIVITLNPSPAVEYMFGSDSVTYLSFTLDLAFKDRHTKTPASTLYERDDLAQWYLDNLQSTIESIDWSEINLSEQPMATGRTHEEFNKDMQTYLYGCSLNLQIAFKT
jgi:hypothetical protein